MSGYTRIRDLARAGALPFRRLDALQLMKHALALRAQAHRRTEEARRPILLYLYAEPAAWPDGTPVSADARSEHRAEVDVFRSYVAQDEVRFAATSYSDLIESWANSPFAEVRDHARAVQRWARLGQESTEAARYPIDDPGALEIAAREILGLLGATDDGPAAGLRSLEELPPVYAAAVAFMTASLMVESTSEVGGKPLAAIARMALAVAQDRYPRCFAPSGEAPDWL